MSGPHQSWVNNDVACHAHGVHEVALHLVQYVLAGAAQQDGAGLRAVGEDRG